MVISGTTEASETARRTGVRKRFRLSWMLSEDDLKFVTPIFIESDEFPVDFGGKIAQYGEIGGVNAQGWRGEQETRGPRRNLGIGKVAFALECR